MNTPSSSNDSDSAETGTPTDKVSTAPSSSTSISSSKSEETPAKGPVHSPAKKVIWEVIGLAIVTLLAIVVFAGLGYLIWRTSLSMEQAKAESESARPATATNVEVQVVRPRTVTERIRLPGFLQPWEDVQVASLVAGDVIEILADDGAEVRAGDPLLQIDPRDYEIALRDAKASLLLARQNLNRTRLLIDQGIRTPEELDADASVYARAKVALDRAALDLKRCTIASPIEGRVEDLIPEVGEYIKIGQSVARVLKTDPLKVEIAIPEKDRKSVEDLTSVHLSIPAALSENTDWTATRTFLSDSPDPRAFVYILRLSLPNPTGALNAGMFVEADVIKDVRPGSIVVPLFSVIPEGETEQYTVFVIDETKTRELKAEDDGESTPFAIVEARPVEIGIIQGESVEIVKGLGEGERLITLGQRSLEPGARVRITRTRTETGDNVPLPPRETPE